MASGHTVQDDRSERIRSEGKMDCHRLGKGLLCLCVALVPCMAVTQEAEIRPLLVELGRDGTSLCHERTFLEIDGNLVAAADSCATGSFQVYVYDIARGVTIPVASGSPDHIDPAISGTRVAYRDDRSGVTQVYVYDLVTDKETPITTGPEESNWPSLSGDRLVFATHQSIGGWQIFLKDLVDGGTPVAITDDTALPHEPVIDGDLIVWVDERHGWEGGLHMSDIYAYDLATGEETRITTDSGYVGNVAVSGRKIVWTDERDEQQDIYMYDLDAGGEVRITYDPADQHSASISGNRIIWTDNRHGNTEIYRYDLGTGEEQRLTTSIVDHWTADIDGDRVAWFEFHKGIPKMYLYSGGYTPVGSDVVVSPEDSNGDTVPVELTFDEITGTGSCTVTTQQAGTPPPSGFKIGQPPTYYAITTTAEFDGLITICVNYSGISFGNENGIKLFHDVGGNWDDITTSLDIDTTTVCGRTDGLSPFALFEPSYQFVGFLPPVENPPTVNRAKAGRTVPVKWRLEDGTGAAIDDLDQVDEILAFSASCDDYAMEGENVVHETLDDGASGLTYDPIEEQFMYRWKTDKSMGGSCYRLVVRMADGSEHDARFEMK